MLCFNVCVWVGLFCLFFFGGGDVLILEQCFVTYVCEKHYKSKVLHTYKVQIIANGFLENDKFDGLTVTRS